MANWETLWDGEAIDGVTSGDNGDFFWLWSDPSENLLSVGDTVRVTVDGTVYNLTVQAGVNDGFVEAGNKWLYAGSTADDGTDVYFWEYSGGLRFYTRTMYYTKMPHVKFERAVSVPTPDPLSLVMGYRVGCAIRANRGK